MHTTSGALIAGLGGGSAVGGAAGAGISSALSGKLNQMADQFETGDGSGMDPGLTAGNFAANLVAGGIGGLVGGNSGAFSAANMELYNANNDNGQGKGGTGSELMDKGVAAANAVSDWLKNTYGDIPGTLSEWSNQLTRRMNADATAKAGERPSDLMAQGAANGLNAVVSAGGGKPPMASPGLVLVDSAAGGVRSLAAPVPSNATLNSGNDGDSSRLADGGGLQAHEDAGGHLLDKHVGKSEQDLATRLANDPKISGSSSFPDRATAENFVSQALDANKSTITDWLAGSSSRLRLDYSSSDPTGISVAKGTSGAVDVNSARVILVRDPSMPTGYKILTGYPTKP
ncbi:hemagglutinin [Caballeronia novacaledonica]|uniref:Hemagglutinin n=2 Tax=Caballeronia novacaledonica TaxID=1544861 RepID=A0A2U3IAC7_9BURK|nr:hemagglutinin [Caballeronia novacaledonica]